MKFEAYYGTMAGWGSTTDFGISTHKNGCFISSRLAYVQTFSIGEDSEHLGFVIGAGKEWQLPKQWYAGSQIDLRWSDPNLKDVGLGWIAPSIYLGHAWEFASCQLQFGLPYFLGIQAKFPFEF